MEYKLDYILKYLEKTPDTEIIDIFYKILTIDRKESNQDSILEEIMYKISNNIIDNNKINSNLLISKIDSINSINLKDKGKICEANYLELLQDSLSGCKVTKPGNYSCDILIESSLKPDILIEIKDYKEQVPTSQVEKFHRDLRKNKTSGILVSKSSSIAAKKNCQYDDLGDNIFCFYIPKNSYNIEVIISCYQCILNIHNFIDKENVEYISEIDKQEFDSIKKELEEKDRYLLKLLEDMKKRYDSLGLEYKDLYKYIKGVSNKSVNSDIFVDKKIDRENILCQFCNQVHQVTPSNRRKHLSKCKHSTSEIITKSSYKKWYTYIDDSDKCTQCTDCGISVNIDKKSLWDHNVLFHLKNRIGGE